MNNTVTASGEKSSREVRQGLLLGGLAVLVIVLAIISLFVGRLGIGGVADLLLVRHELELLALRVSAAGPLLERAQRLGRDVLVRRA